MSKPDGMTKVLEQIEHQFRFQGIWQPPDEEYPKIRIRPDWKPNMVNLAETLNRIFYIRSLPAVARLYGPVPDSSADEFLHDFSTVEERREYVENALRRLVDELDLLPQFDATLLDLEEES